MIPVAITWYESDAEYQAMLAILPIEETHDTISYSDLVNRTKRFEQDIHTAGQLPMRVKVTASAFKTWCETNNRPVAKLGISDYITQRLGEQILDKGSN